MHATQCRSSTDVTYLWYWCFCWGYYFFWQRPLVLTQAHPWPWLPAPRHLGGSKWLNSDQCKWQKWCTRGPQKPSRLCLLLFPFLSQQTPWLLVEAGRTIKGKEHEYYPRTSQESHTSETYAMDSEWIRHKPFFSVKLPWGKLAPPSTTDTLAYVTVMEGCPMYHRMFSGCPAL